MHRDPAFVKSPPSAAARAGPRPAAPRTEAAPSAAARVQMLQRLIGNQAVLRMLSPRAPGSSTATTGGGGHGPVQRLTIKTDRRLLSWLPETIDTAAMTREELEALYTTLTDASETRWAEWSNPKDREAFQEAIGDVTWRVLDAIVKEDFRKPAKKAPARVEEEKQPEKVPVLTPSQSASSEVRESLPMVVEDLVKPKVATKPEPKAGFTRTESFDDFDYWVSGDELWHFTYFKKTGDYHLKGNSGIRKDFQKGFFGGEFKTRIGKKGKNAVEEGTKTYAACVEHIVPLYAELPNYKGKRV